MARSIASWLSGPEPAQAGQYPGQRLGLPRTGPGSAAGFGRRLLALTVDYFIAVGLTAMAVPLGLITQDAFQYSTDVRLLIIVIWLLLGAVAVRLYGFTPGQLLFGLQVTTVSTAGQHIGTGIGRALARGVLIALVIPALFTDADGRGLHDRATGTAVVRR